MKYEYTLYLENGDERKFVNVDKWPLSRMQRAVGGLIELLPREITPNLKGKYDAYGNDEAKLIGMEPNVNFPIAPWGDWIAGPVLVERVYHDKT